MKRPGERIGKYEIEAHLGSGGNGAVYRARDTQLGRKVALKLLHEQLTFDAGIAGRFRAEAEAMARLNHPNVVTVHDFVGEANTWAIVMELVEGGETLGSVLERDRQLDCARAFRIGADVASGLGHAHARGIVHRDVKPANILLVRDGHGERAKVTDFGIARLLDGERRTRQNTTLGTLYYLAPEQALDSHVDRRADFYSLGVTLYEAVAGRVPFPYDNPARVLQAHIGEAPVPPSALAPGLVPGAERLIMSLLAKRPEERPGDGAALAAQFQALLTPGSRPSLPVTRAMASVPPAEVPVAKPAPLAPGAEPLDLATMARDARRGRERRTALWISVGAVLLLGGVCLVGGGLSVMTCALSPPTPTAPLTPGAPTGAPTGPVPAGSGLVPP